MKGKFELANGGAIFLDEISDMSPLAQVKILRVLEYGDFERLGSERMLKTDARIICATNVSLRERVRHGKFREDLYHRLNGLTILIPALRDRQEELPGLIANELKVSALRMGKKITAIHPAAMDRLLTHVYAVRVPDRDEVLRQLEARGIGSGVHYPVPVHLQQAYASLGHERGAFPVSEQIAREFLSLPMFPELAAAQVDYVIEAVTEIVSSGVMA